MFTIAGLLLVFVVVGGAFLGLALIAGLAKLVFKVALLPVVLVFAVLKVALCAVGALIGLALMVTLGPVLLVVGAIFLLPLLLIGLLAKAVVSAVA